MSKENDITCDDCKDGICIQTNTACSGLASTDGSTCLMSPNVCGEEWNPRAIEIISGSGGSQWDIDDVIHWMKEHGYEISELNDDNICIKMGDMSGDDSAGEVGIPISYILENKADFQAFKDIIEYIKK